jgi:outer membrane protein assembly factor BamA
VDSIQIKNDMQVAYINAGTSFKWATLKRGNVDDFILGKIGFRDKLYQNKPLYYTELAGIMQSLQSYAENHGYPFATVGLDSVQINEDASISAQLHLEKYTLITYEGIEIVGENVKISKKYLQQYLGIKPGDVYNLAQIKKIPTRINELPFLKEKKTAIVTFRGRKATINLFLEKRKASKFDFLIGVLPRDQNTGSKILVTIDGMFSTQNLLGGGEKIFVEFRQVKAGTQRMNIQLGYPYVIGLPFGVDGDFSLYKRDSTFLDVEYDAGLSYLFSANHYIKAFGHSKQSILLVVDEEKILQTKQLPDNLDTKFSDFGLEYHIENLDYKFNPRKGWSLTSRAAAGFRTIKKNNDIVNLSDPLQPTFRFESLYDSLEKRSFQYKLDGQIAGFIPFYPKQRGVFMIKNSTGAMISPQSIYLNEQYRLGGTNSFRGFDEEAINASLFSIFTLEYRFIIGKNSYFYLFSDYGYTESKAPTGKVKDDPFGFGVGMTFDTKIGLFGISYAYGKQFDNPIDFRVPKIHLGYVNFF